MFGSMLRALALPLAFALAFSGCSCGSTQTGTTGSTGTSATGGGTGTSGSSGTGAPCTGSAPLCTLQQGVCAGKHAACVNGNWAPCTAAEYGAGYSAIENICDGSDHNCDGTPSGTVDCAGFCCRAGQACASGACVDLGATCLSDSECQSDSHCVGGSCVRWDDGGFDSACSHPLQPPHFSPSIRCAWPNTSATFPDAAWIQVITTPLAADFQMYPTAHPMVVFPTQNSLGGGDDECVGNATNYGLLRILDPQSCTVVATLDAADQHIIGSSTPAIGDLDGAGGPEIVAASVGGGLVAFTYDQALGQWRTLWHSTNADGSASTLNAGSCEYAGPSIADVDGDGLPEILYGGVIHDRTGKIVGSSLGMVPFRSGQIPVLADVDLDGGPELVTGNRLFTYSPAQHDFVAAPYFNTAGLADGFTAVARFGSFPVFGAADPGYPQVAVVSNGSVRVQAIDGSVVFGPYSLPGSGGGGPPTVGDFNGDGQPDIAAAGSDSFTVFSLHCVPTDAGLPADCQAPGILWSRPSQDHSSNVTGSSLFDFTGSGSVDGVYADECFARVFDGHTGEVVYSQWHSSCTWYENPIVADVLGNYSSQLIVGSNTNCGITCPGSVDTDPQGRKVDKFFNGLTCQTAADCPGAADTCVAGLCRCTTDDDCCGTAGACPSQGFVCAPPPASAPGAGNTCRAIYNAPYGGIRIYADAQNRWADSRGIWNQHAYAVTNVNDDGTIPSAAQARHNWLTQGLNNFRQNVQGGLTPLAAAHLSISFDRATCTADGGFIADVLATVCNRGASGVVSGVPVQFSDLAGDSICSASTSAPLAPGACVQVQCDGPVPTSPGTKLVAVVDPDATTRPCDGASNASTLEGFGCGTFR